MYPFKAGVRYWPNEELVKSVSRRGDGAARCAVDVGCGSGNNLPVLIEHDYAVIAIDQSSDMTDESARWLAHLDYNEECVEFLIGKSHEIEIPRASLIVDSMMSQHLIDEDYGTFLDNARAAIRDDGWMFTYHLTGCTDNLFPAHRHDLYPRSHARLMTIFQSHGFRVKHAWWKEVTVGNTFAKYVAIESEPC